MSMGTTSDRPGAGNGHLIAPLPPPVPPSPSQPGGVPVSPFASPSTVLLSEPTVEEANNTHDIPRPCNQPNTASVVPARLPPSPALGVRTAACSRLGSAASRHSHSRPGSGASLRSDIGGGGLAPQAARSGGSRTQVHMARPSVLGRAASEAGSQSSMTLETVMSQLQMVSEGPSECRTLMPGLDLVEHGLADLDLQSHGGVLPVVTAPRGINLRVAICQCLSQHQQLEGSSSAPRSSTHPHASVPGTPATLPCGMGSVAGTPLAAPSSLAQLPGTPTGGEQLEQGAAAAPPPLQQLERWQGSIQMQGALGGDDATPAEEQTQRADDSATWQWLAKSRLSDRSSDGERGRGATARLGPRHASDMPPRGDAGWDAAEGACASQSAAESAQSFELQQTVQTRRHMQQGALEQDTQPAGQGTQQGLARPRATTLDRIELLGGAAPLGRLDGARSWSHDGVGGPAAGAVGAALDGQRHASQLDVAYRARASARMWPMLAPFVPRLLRQYIVQAQATPGGAGGGAKPIFEGFGKALGCSASVVPHRLSRTMRPTMESFPAAVMIADVSGFTALTEALGGQGSAGVELLTKCMNRYFTEVIDLLLLYGGDVEKFAGDCMIVVFLPTQQEAQGSEDGGLAAAALRAATCGAQLASRFGTMRMLPNGEVVPVSAVERKGGAKAATAANADVELQDGDIHEGLVPRLASRGAGAAFTAARGSARVAAKAATGSAWVTARAASTGVRVTGAATSGGVQAAAHALGAGVGAASAAAKVASPHRLLTRGQRGTKSDVHLAAIGRGTSSAEGGPSRTSSGSLVFASGLLRTHSSPDASLVPDRAGLASGEGGGGSEPASPHGHAKSALLRQGSAMASAVLSRLSRGSSPRASHHSRQRSGRISVDGGAEAQAATWQQRQQAAEQGAAVPASAAIGEFGTSGVGNDHRVGSSAPLSAAELRQQRERRLHEQALAELVLLAGPAGGSRPPELPSAAATAEAAAARLAEQRAIYQHSRHASAPTGKQGPCAAGNSSGSGSTSSTTGASQPMRASTAPPAVSSLLQDIAAEETGRLAGVKEDGDEQELEATAADASHHAPPHMRTQGRERHLPPALPFAIFEDGQAVSACNKAAQEASSDQAPGAQAAQQQRGSIHDRGADVQAVEPTAPGDAAGGGDAPCPLTSSETAEAELGKKRRPSMLQRLLSAASMPWRGRTVSSGGGGGEGSAAGCQSSNVSMLSDGTLAPAAASLAELSSALGVHPIGASQSPRPAAGSRSGAASGVKPFGRRRQRHSSGSWFLHAAQAQQQIRDASQGIFRRSPGAYGVGDMQSLFANAAAGATVPGDVAASGAVFSGGGPEVPNSDPGLVPAAGSKQQVQAMMQKVVLSLKVILAAGTACAFHVGGNLETAADDSSAVPRWEFFIGDPPQPAGNDEIDSAAEGGSSRRPPIAQLQAAEQFAIAGEAILSPEVVDMVGASCLLEPLPGGNARLVELRAPYELPPEVQQEAEATSLERAAKQIARERAALQRLPEVAQGHALQLLRMHLLENVRVRVEAGHIDYVNELRVGTVLFLGFPFLLEPPPRAGPVSARTGLAAVQACMDVVQRRMRQHDGSLLQFRCDEKGFLAICAFGLPGRSHEDDPARGIQAALAIVEAIKRRGGRACCGVTTGQLFCAMVGSQRRSEYTVFGNAINLSARLMVRARDCLAEVYCDATTHQLAKHKARYVQLDPVRVKGRQTPVDIFEATSLHADAPSQKHVLSPLGPQLLSKLPPAAEVAAAAAGLSRMGSSVRGDAGLSRGGSGVDGAAVPREAAAPAETGMEGLVALAQQLPAPQGQNQEQQGALESGAECRQAPPGMLQLSDRLLSIASTAAAPMQFVPHTPMIARDAELAAITERCVELVQQRRGGLVMIEGDAGMGKSRLVEELQRSELGGVFEACNLFQGLARRERKSQALYPWRRVLREMFHHDAQLGQLYCLRGTNPVMVATELALRLQAAVPDYAQWRHLLADALDLPLSELPAALPTLEQHRRQLAEDYLRDGKASRGVSHEPLHLLPDVEALLPVGADADAFTDKLRDEESEFLASADCAKDFVARMQRSASISLGRLGQQHRMPPVQLDATRALTPSPRKLRLVQKRHEAALWQQAQAAASVHKVGSPGSMSSGGSDAGGDSSSGCGTYTSSPTSSFTGSLNSLPGSPRPSDPVLAGNAEEPLGGGSRLQRGWRGGRSHRQAGTRLQRSATSRGAGTLNLRPSSPGREISTHLRVKKVQELVVAIIRQFTEAYGPLILVLEDLHHFDTASWRLLTTAVADQGLKGSVLMVVTYRPYFGVLSPALRQRGGSRELLYNHVRAAYHAVLSQPTTLHLVLKPFTMEQSRSFVSAALGGAHVPPEVAALLWERSSGLPSFLEQLVVFLNLFVHTQLQNSSMAPGGSEDGAGPRRRSTLDEVLSMAQAGLDFIRSNVSINSIITDRVDRLRPNEQLTLKVASVLGLTVYRQLLQAIHPQRPTAAALDASLCALEAASFLGRDPQEPTTWRFCQVLARDVVYELVPQNVRRDWHAAAAAAMEAYSSDQVHLPASTVAWHWDHSCRGAEAPQWQRSFQAVEWWERAAAVALDNGAYADALPLLQRAQDVAAKLERYFDEHSHSFLLMVQDQRAAAGGGDAAGGAPPGRLPSSRSALTLDSVLSTHGTSQLPTAVPADLPLPLVPCVRRAHWERCMAAMCVAAELSAESLHEAKRHCLLALNLLGVPLPSSEEYQEWQSKQERQWHWPQGRRLACLTPWGCGSGDGGTLQQRTADLEGGAYLWMARPDPFVARSPAGSAHPQHKQRRWAKAAAGVLRAGRLPVAEAEGAPGAAAAQDSDATPAGSGGEQGFASLDTLGRASGLYSGTTWAVMPTPAPALVAGKASLAVAGGSCPWGFPSADPPRATPPPVLGTVHEDLATLSCRLGQGTAKPAPQLLQPSPFAAHPSQAAAPDPTAGPAESQAGVAAGTGGGAGAWAGLPAGPGRSAANRLSGSLGRCPTRSSGAHSHSLGLSHSMHSTQEESAQQQVASQPGVHIAPPATANSQQYRAWQTAGLAAAADAADAPGEQQVGLARGSSDLPIHVPERLPESLTVLPAHSGQADAEPSLQAQQEQLQQQQQERLRRQAMAFGLAAADERYSPQAKAEASVVLHLLCSLLLAVPPRLADHQGARYVRWACRHLQGGRVRQSSPFWQVHHDCDMALRSLRQQATGGPAVPAPRPPPQGRSGPGAWLSRVSQRSALPNSLATIAGAVTRTSRQPIAETAL